MNATDRFNLTILGRATVDSVEYVVYNDGTYGAIVEAEAFDADLDDVLLGSDDETDYYTAWCYTVDCLQKEELAVRVLDAANVDRINDANMGAVFSTTYAAELAADDLDDDSGEE